MKYAFPYSLDTRPLSYTLHDILSFASDLYGSYPKFSITTEMLGYESTALVEVACFLILLYSNSVNGIVNNSGVEERYLGRLM